MDLAEFWRSAPEAGGWNHADKIKFFAWYLHRYRGAASFTGADIRACFEELHLDGPTSIGPYLRAMAHRKPKDALQSGSSYRLEHRVRESFERRFGQREASIQVHKLLAELPAKLPNEADKVFLDETLRCFKCGAYRATIVMAWNLAYDHFCVWILNKHLATFNAEMVRRFPKLVPITKRDDFTELKESQVIDISRSAGIISGSVLKVLDEKLKKRNLAAHPSGVAATQLTAEEVTADLVENVVLKLS